ncbi:MAG: class I SAM-dependent methyltransferase [Clostridia bacterium]|nr:class I SAM-dependent methyltransferase [Clostridia bacterium]
MATIDYKWYSGTDEYSDGDIENDILGYFKKYGSKHLEKVFRHDDRWATFYHLTPLRENIVKFYEFKPGASVLEVGAGFGAVTGALCEKAKHVTAVELSKRRAEGLYERHKKRKNLDVLVGNLNDISFPEKFDYITLIGVLEYALSFTVSEHPYEDFLTGIRSLLKPDGKLLIAIENRYGLKYWCGAPEDHTGKPFDGINGYEGVAFVRTFGKAELSELLNSCGFRSLKYYYPYPDYKMPLAVFSDENLPADAGALTNIIDPHPYDSELIPDEKALIPSLVRNGVFPFFSNSFFVEAGF